MIISLLYMEHCILFCCVSTLAGYMLVWWHRTLVCVCWYRGTLNFDNPYTCERNDISQVTPSISTVSLCIFLSSKCTKYHHPTLVFLSLFAIFHIHNLALFSLDYIDRYIIYVIMYVKCSPNVYAYITVIKQSWGSPQNLRVCCVWN